MIPEWIYELPWGVIRRESAEHKLDPLLVASIIQVESAGNTYAMRYEPAWRYHYYAREISQNVGSSLETENKGQATSWGLMQVMGTVAREYGFKGWFSQLCEPELGLKYGCLHLKKKFEKYGSMDKAVAAYNAGNVRYQKSGIFVNERYVDKVMRFFRELNQI